MKGLMSGLPPQRRDDHGGPVKLSGLAVVVTPTHKFLGKMIPT